MRSAVPHPHAAGLSAVNYRSVADPALCDPVRFAGIVAQMRISNRDCNVTGAITCDGGTIEQWIEGPDATVAALWDRIRLDPRHRIEWASAPAVVTARHFPGSPMKLAMTTCDLARLDPWLIDDVVTLSDGSALPGPRGDRATDPALRARTCRLVQARAVVLAEVLTGTDARAARLQLDAAITDTGLAECAALVQALLDQVEADWMAGFTTDLQRQLVLTMLQSSLRIWLDIDEEPETIGCALVAALPGTPDLCGVMLKVALLRQAGWSVRLLLPQTADRIIGVAQDLQPDLIVLAGSRLSVRPTELPLLKGLLPALKAESGAPVILGGKLAETDPQALLGLGGTAVCSAMAWIATIAAAHAPPELGWRNGPNDMPGRARPDTTQTSVLGSRARWG